MHASYIVNAMAGGAVLQLDFCSSTDTIYK
jgi:hypothetical protein